MGRTGGIDVKAEDIIDIIDGYFGYYPGVWERMSSFLCLDKHLLTRRSQKKKRKGIEAK